MQTQTPTPVNQPLTIVEAFAPDRWQVTYENGQVRRYDNVTTAVALAFSSMSAAGLMEVHTEDDALFEAAVAQYEKSMRDEEARRRRRNAYAGAGQSTCDHRSPITGHFTGGDRGGR